MKEFNLTMDAVYQARRALEELCEIGVSYLEKYYNPKDKLFPFTVRLDRGRLRPEGMSIRYTIIALIGLESHVRYGARTNLAPDKMLNQLLENREVIRNGGDFGLLLWAAALSPNKKGLENALKGDGGIVSIDKETVVQLTTLELEFLLVGLCYACKELGFPRSMEVKGRLVYEELLSSFARKTGVFCFKYYPGNGTIRSLYNKKMGFFAEQAYGIYALTTCYETFGWTKALEKAVQCADKLYNLQGKSGEWMWQYSARHGHVIDKYPVYSVHQDGMAPMALAKLMKFSNREYAENILKGLQWLQAYRETERSLIDWDNRVIWRSVKRKGVSRFFSALSKASALIDLNIKGISRPAKGFKIDRETRPYHYGWILEAQKEIRELSEGFMNEKGKQPWSESGKPGAGSGKAKRICQYWHLGDRV